MGKKKEFDFDKSYSQFMKQADELGMKEDMAFQTLMEEFKRMKNVCDGLYKGIEEMGVSFIEEGSKGQSVYKTNPCVKDYVSAHKTLVSTCDAIKTMLDKVPKQENNDWL